MTDTKLHVICHRPGLIRGGRANPAHASYAPGDLTPEQLAELAAEPEITLIVGSVPGEAELEMLAKLVDERRPDEPGADRKGKK